MALLALDVGTHRHPCQPHPSSSTLHWCLFDYMGAWWVLQGGGKELQRRFSQLVGGGASPLRAKTQTFERLEAWGVIQ